MTHFHAKPVEKPAAFGDRRSTDDVIARMGVEMRGQIGDLLHIENGIAFEEAEGPVLFSAIAILDLFYRRAVIDD